MKARIRLIALLCMVLALTVTTGAMADNEVRMFYDSAAELMFETGNVTLAGQAEFSLDGERFKTAKIRYIQDYTNSLLQLDLLTPRRSDPEGADRESGYTVIANGEDVYVMEVFHPGVYRTGTTEEQSAILRKSVQMNLMTEVLRVLADQAGAMEGENTVTVRTDGQGGKELQISVGEDVPELVNTALNVLYQFAAKRYFDMDYDNVSERDMGPMENYITVTEGILRTTKSVALKKAEVTVKTDGAGNMEQAKGEVSVKLDTGKNGIRQMDIAFDAEVSDRGESRVAEFSPEEYGVTRQGGPEEPAGYEAGERVYFDGEERRLLTEDARKLCRQSGYAAMAEYDGTAYTENGRVYIDLGNEDGTDRIQIFTDADGKPLGLYHETNSFQKVNMDQYHYDGYPDNQVVVDAAEKVLQYLREVAPEALDRIDQIAPEWWYETDGELFLEFHEDPIAQDWDGILITVRVQPEWRIEYFSCVSNG